MHAASSPPACMNWLAKEFEPRISLDSRPTGSAKLSGSKKSKEATSNRIVGSRRRVSWMPWRFGSPPAGRKGAWRSCAVATTVLLTPCAPPPLASGHARRRVRWSSWRTAMMQRRTPLWSRSLLPITSGKIRRLMAWRSATSPAGLSSWRACSGDIPSACPAIRRSARLSPSLIRHTDMQASLVGPKLVRLLIRRTAPSTAPVRAGTPSATSIAGEEPATFHVSSFFRLRRRGSVRSSLGGVGIDPENEEAPTVGRSSCRTAAQALAAALERNMSVDTF
mmetsp:Transcript_23406/g.56010  ORF Transcript_23406/g.56010 Transcript_23406/m.56010 type:complete len:279 (-) Transcript_23406:2731-3567(-)